MRAGSWCQTLQEAADKDGLEGQPSPMGDHHRNNQLKTASHAMQSQLIPKMTTFGLKATPALLFDYTLCIIPTVKL